MNQISNFISISPAFERAISRTGLDPSGKKEEKSQVLLYGLVRLVFITALIAFALIAGA